MDNSLKDKVLESVDIVEVVGERVALTRKGKDYVGLCPFHPDHKPSLSVSPTKQIFKCWSCGAGGDVIGFVQKYDRLDFREALATLARRAGINVTSSPADRRSGKLRAEIQAALRWVGEHFRQNLEATPPGQRARQYALDRGLTPETIDRFALGYAAESNVLRSAARRAGLSDEILLQAGLTAKSDDGRTYDRFRNRLIFPIADATGRPIAFGGRTLGDDRAKYLNSPETPLFSKSRVLYGLDLAQRAIDRERAVIIVEGYLDAVLLSQFGFENVVATLGTALTDAHVQLLRRRADKLHLCFDSDQAGVRAADRAVEVALRTQTEVRVVLLPAGQDPADCVLGSGHDGFSEYLKGAVDALEFKWSQVLRDLDQGGPQGRRAALDEFVRFVAGAAAGGGLIPQQQDLLNGRLSEVLGVPPEVAFDMLAAAKLARRRPTGRASAGADGVSAYEVTIRGLPGGLVRAVETVLGLLLADVDCWQWVDDAVARSMRFSRAWERLYQVFLDVHRDSGEYSITEVVRRCDDGAVCELVDRAVGLVPGEHSAGTAFQAAKERLTAELDLMRMSDLRRDLHVENDDGKAGLDAFDSLRELARNHHSVARAEWRWNAASVS